MIEMQNNIYTEDVVDNGFKIRETILSYLKYWKWFLFSILVFFNFS